jgi:hypothetical protein
MNKLILKNIKLGKNGSPVIKESNASLYEFDADYLGK